MSSTKLENPKEMYNFHNSYHLSHEQTNNLNRLIIPKEIEVGIKILPSKNVLGPDGFNREFDQIFKEVIITIFLILVHEIETKETLTNSFCEVKATMEHKTHEDSAKRENYRPIFLMNTGEKYSIKYTKTESKNESKR